MKSLNIILSTFAILIFSGCYTQLLIEDDTPAAAYTQPVVSNPNRLPPADPIIYAVPVPEPIYVPVSYPVMQPSYSSPASPTAPTAAPTRTSGYQRSGSESSQQNTQTTTRTEGSRRGGK